MKKSSKDLFISKFGYSPAITAFAPGRVNLIGEHTDYNGGYVFPCAINLGIEGSAAVRTDDRIRLVSGNFPNSGIIEMSIDELLPSKRWIDYVIGVIKSFGEIADPIKFGLDIAVIGDLPDGSGLSSSAALEVLTGFILSELFEQGSVTKKEIALIGQHSENNFIGVSCGIMDQFASAMGKEGSAILLDSSKLNYDYSPLPSGEISVIIVNSGVKHSLASSEYNTRHLECNEALNVLRALCNVYSLCELTGKEFEKYSSYIKNDTVRKRAAHAISENERTLKAADALKARDYITFGRLMNESHSSLRYDYEVSCDELDFLVDTAQGFSGVYGSRMTGGGFGGCTVNLVKKEQTEGFVRSICSEYKNKFGIDAKCYTVRASEGVHRVL